MIRLAWALIALLVAAPAFAQSAADHVRDADERYRAGDYGASAEAYQLAIDAGAKNPTTFYNAACSSALAGESDEAFARLGGAIERGFRDLALLESDSDLASLHDDGRWMTTVGQCRTAIAEFEASIGNPDLRREILEMSRVDQAARRGQDIPELDGLTMTDVDRRNTARMKEVIAEAGWPGATLVGEDGASSAWLLVQHADLDPEFQRHCLELMKAMPEGEIDPVDLAYLTDRVLVNEGEPQIYGTQFWSPDGTRQPRPIAEPMKVEELRAAIGMMSMQDYHQRMTGRDWDPAAH